MAGTQILGAFHEQSSVMPLWEWGIDQPLPEPHDTGSSALHF